VRSYAVYVESFDTPWSFIIASKDKDPMDWTSEELHGAIISLAHVLFTKEHKRCY